MVVADILSAAIEPLTHPLGWQGFAYGLLGLRMMRRVIEWARDVFDPRRESTVEVITKSRRGEDEDTEAVDDPQNLYDHK